MIKEVAEFINNNNHIPNEVFLVDVESGKFMSNTDFGFYVLTRLAGDDVQRAVEGMVQAEAEGEQGVLRFLREQVRAYFSESPIA